MGLVKEGDKYAILTDIAGAEDHYGDMDFKVAGTRNGITALQMDIKIMGITPQIMREALAQAKRARIFLLDKMDAVITEEIMKVALAQASEGRMFLLDKMEEALPQAGEGSKFAPRIHTIMIPTDKIRDLIGPGGKVIRGIIDATGVKIDVDDTGRVNVASSDAEGLAKAIQMISDLTAVPEVGKTYLGKVVRLAEFGAFVEIFPGTDGLLHVSEIAEHRVKEVKDELREGDQVLVKVLAIEGNRIKLSRKAVLKEQRAKLGLPDPEQGSGGGESRSERSERGGRSERGDRAERGARAPRPERAEQTEKPQHEQTITIEGGDDFDDDDEDLDDEIEGDEDEAGDEAEEPVAAGSASEQGGGAAPQAGGAKPAGGGTRRRRRRGGRRGGPGAPGGNGGGQQGGGESR